MRRALASDSLRCEADIANGEFASLIGHVCQVRSVSVFIGYVEQNVSVQLTLLYAVGIGREADAASATFSSRRPSKPLFVRPAAPVRTAAVPDRFSRANVPSWTACSTVLPAHRAVTVLPGTLKAAVHRQSNGSLTEPASLREALLPRAVCAGTAAVRTALPARVVSNCAAWLCHQTQL